MDRPWTTYVLTSYINAATGSAIVQVGHEVVIVIFVYLHTCGTVHVYVAHRYRYAGTYAPVSAAERYIYLALVIIVYVIIPIIYIPHGARVVVNNPTLYRGMVVVMDDAHLVVAVAIVMVHMLVTMTFAMMMAPAITLCIYAHTGTR